MVGLFHIQSAHGFGFQDIVLEATEGVPNFPTGSPTVSFSPSHPGWRTRRRFKKWSHKTNSSLPDSQQFWVPKHESCEGDAACEPSEPTLAFLSSFNPASSGMELLVAERLDRLMHHVSVPTKNTKHTVSINLEQSLNSIISCAGKWFFPAADESVFNSIGTGLDAPLVVDSGASCCITPHREDFTSYGTSKVKVKDLSGVNRVAGEGMINWKVLDSYGAEYTIKLKAYHMPGASVRLLSPQSLYTSIKGSDGHQDATKYTMYIPSVDGDITLEATYGRANLPLLQMSSPTDTRCLWSRTFAFPAGDQTSWAHGIASARNQNLTAAQKEVLLWHFKLSHAGMSSIHNLCRQKRTAKVDTVDELMQYRTSNFLPCKHKPQNNACDGLICASCVASKSKRRSPTNRPSTSRGPEMTLKQDHLNPGDCVSCDHYISPIPGRAIAVSGHSSSAHGYNCGTIYVDHATGFVFVRHQTSTSAQETIRSKMLLEREARDVGVSIKKYHSDNGVFSSKEFRSHCEELNQKLSFSGVGAK